MSEVEIERLVVRLLGDGTAYVNMLNQAVKHTEESAKHIEHAAQEIEGFQHKIEEFGESAEKALLKVGVAVGLFEAFEHFEQAEKTMIRLESAIEGNGNAIEPTLNEYKKFAAEMQNTTNTAKGTTLELLKRAETFQLTGDMAKSATKDAITLAAATEEGAEGMIRIASKMAEGNIQGAMLAARHVEQLRGITDETEFTDRYTKLLETGMKTLGKEMDTVGGRIEHMKQQLGSLTKDLGHIVSEALAPLVERLSEAVTWFNSLSSETRKYAIYTLLAVGAINPLLMVYGRLSAAVYSVAAAYTWLRSVAVTEWIMTQVGQLLLLKDAFMSGERQISLYGAQMIAVGGIIMSVVLVATIALRSAQEELNDSMQRGTGLSQKLGEAQERASKSVMARAESIKNLPERQKFLEDQLKAAAKEQEGQKNALAAADKEIANLRGGTVGGILRSIPGVGAGKQADVDEAIARQKALQDAFGITNKKIEEMQKALRKSKTVGSDDSGAAKNDLMTRLNAELNAIGATRDQIEAYNLSLHHYTEAEVKAAQASVRTVEFFKEEYEFQNKLDGGIQEYVQHLNDETEALETTAEAAKRKAFMLDGATNAQLKAIDAALASNVAAKEHDKIMKGIDETTRQHQSPLEEFTARQKELNDQLTNGLKPEVYTRAIDAAQKKFDEATNSVRGLGNEINKLDGTLAGSAEAKARQTAYLDLIKGDKLFQRKPSDILVAQTGANSNQLPSAVNNNTLTTNTSTDSTVISLLRQIRDNGLPAKGLDRAPPARSADV